MKSLVMLLSLFSTLNIAFPKKGEAQSFYELKANTIDGKELDFATLKGKKVLIVNTASKCGFTPQFMELQEVHEKYGSDKFLILGFPSNDFGAQDPGSNEEIAQFCQKNYGVTFQMMEKVVVKGDEKHPVYEWLTNKSVNGVKSTSVKWNFQKYLVDENGNWVDTYASTTKPDDKAIVDWITK